MTKQEEDRIVIRAEAINELRRLDKISVSIPQQMSLRLSTLPASIGQLGIVTFTDNFPHCHWLESAANAAFRMNLQRAIQQYRKILSEVAESGEYP